LPSPQRQPPFGEVVGDGDPLGGAVVAVVHPLDELAEHLLGVPAGGAAGVPAVALLAGGGVGAPVDDGVVPVALPGDVTAHRSSSRPPHRWPASPPHARNVVREWEDGELRVPDRGEVLPWSLGVEHLAGANLYWHVVGRPSGGSHVRPVFAVVCDGVLWSTTSADARKARLLAEHPSCSLAASTDGMDIVYDGIAVAVRDPEQLERVAQAYRDKYGWPVTVADGAFDAPFGAPAAGAPPYLVYAYEPVTVWG